MPNTFLKPCPCCTGQAVISEERRAVDCMSCGLTTGVRYSLPLAIAVWNTRVERGEGQLKYVTTQARGVVYVVEAGG
jgi:hypothetical protein